MKAEPFGNEELSKIKSAGNSFSFYTLQISPTKTCPHLRSICHYPFRKTFVFSLLSFLSDLYLWKSSYPSLIIEIPITIINGDQAVKGFRGDIIFMERRMAIIRK